MEYAEMARAENLGAWIDTELLTQPGDSLDPGNWDELQVRDALVLLKALDAEAHRLDDLANQIVDRYMARKKKLVERADAIRASVKTYIERFNGGEKLSFPDVGTAYLTTRKAKVSVTDPAELENWMAMEGRDACVVLKEAPMDAKATLELLFDEMGWRVADNGLIVDSDGEIVAELPEGIDTTPEGKTLAVRSA